MGMAESGMSGMSGLMSAAIPSPYPTLSSPTTQGMWIDFLNRSKSDASGLVACNPGDSIQTVPLPAGWDLVSPGGMLIQSILSKRPLFGTDGARTVDATTRMLLPVTINNSGNYTIYFVSSRSTNNDQVEILCDNGSNVTGNFGTSQFYNFSRGGGLTDAVTALSIKRYRSDGSNGYLKVPGASEVSQVLTGTTTWTQTFGRSGDNTSTGARTLQIVLVTANLTPGGADDLAIIAALQALCPTATGP